MMRIIVGILLAVHGVDDIRNLVQKPILLVCTEPVRRGEEGKALGKAVGAECRIPMQKRGVRLLLIDADKHILPEAHMCGSRFAYAAASSDCPLFLHR